MTIASTTIATSGSTGNGATTVFSFTFSVEAYGAVSQAQQIEVIKETIASGAETILTLTTDYTTSFNADQNSNPGGSITMVSAPSSAYRIWIRLSPSFVQATDYQSQGGFLMETVEDQADQHSRQIMWLRDNVRRAPRAGIQAGSSFSGEITGDLTPGYMIGLNASGTGYQWLDPSTGLPAGVVYLSNATGSDELAAIQAIIDARSAAGGGVIYAPPGQTYILNGRLTLKNNVDIYLNGSVFQFVGVNDGVDPQSTGLIANGDLSASGIVGFSGPLYKITDSASYYVRTSSKRQGLCNMRLIGRSSANPQGTGLQLRSDTGGAGIAYLRFENVTVLYFATGAHLYQSGSGWINDNIFEQLLISGCTTNHLYLQGNPCNNNEFHALSIQPNTSLANATRAIECDGDENYFQGKIWDWHASGSTLAVVFSGENNELYDRGLPDQSYVKDKASERLDANIIVLRGGTKVYKSEGFFTPTDSENPSFDGHDDCLAWAHTLRTVTASGDAGTNPNNLFLPGEAVTSWASLTTATYKIDFGSSQTYLFAAGVKFAFGDIADNVTISYSDDDVSYTNLLSVTGNFNHDVNACGKSFIAGTFRYLKFLITNDTGKATKVSRLYAYTPSLRGREFIAHDENNLLGTLSSDQWTRVATGGRTGNDDANAQSVFDSATDTIALDASTLYEFEGQYVISRTAGTTSHTTSVLFNYTGTVNYILWHVLASNANNGALATSLQRARFISLAGGVITAANTSATECVIVDVKGTIRTTNAGAFTPQFQFSVAPGGAPTILAGSMFNIRRIGINTAVSAGPWT